MASGLTMGRVAVFQQCQAHVSGLSSSAGRQAAIGMIFAGCGGALSAGACGVSQRRKCMLWCVRANCFCCVGEVCAGSGFGVLRQQVRSVVCKQRWRAKVQGSLVLCGVVLRGAMAVVQA